MLPVAYSGTLDNAGFDRSYNLCVCAHTYRIYLYVRPETKYGSAAMRSVYAEGMYWANVVVQTPLRTGLLSEPVRGLVSLFRIQPVERAEQVGTVWFCNMKIDHRCFDTLVSQEFFNGNNVHSELQ
jgi:hypothetical protein